MRRRRQVGIAHAEVDDVAAAIAGHRLGAINLLKDVRRQPADAIKLCHERFQARGLGRSPLTTLCTDYYHLVSGHLLSASASCAFSESEVRREAAFAGDKAAGCFFAAAAVADLADGRAEFCFWLLCASALRRSRALIRSSVACCT